MDTQDQNRKLTDSHSQMEITAGSIVADVLCDWPETVPVFLNRHLGCVGCDMSPFDTVADVARIYRFDPGCFLEELQAAVRSSDQDGGQAV